VPGDLPNGQLRQLRRAGHGLPGQLREKKFLDKFLYLLGKYQFNSIAPDQDYINEICSGQIQYLDPSWDAMPNDVDPEMADPCMIHYNLFYKPWHFEDTKYEQLLLGQCR
jgi:lipopolysaccharide biosynthesis glycosyltransferase